MHDDSASFWADIKEYEERLGRDPDSFLFARLAEIYLKVGLVDDALHIARQGVARHPGYVAGLRALALTCHAKGLRDECRSVLQKVTLALPEDGEAQKMLGRLLAGQGDNEAAEKAFRTALEFHPDDVECRVELEALERGMAHPPLELAGTVAVPVAEAPAGDRLDAEFGAFEEEPEELEEIIEDAEILDMDEADLLEEEEAAGVVAEPAEPAASGMEGYDPLSTATLAELYVQQGFTDKALEVYRAILANAPDNVEARSRVAELEGQGVAPDGLAGAAKTRIRADKEPLPAESSFHAPTGAEGALAILEGWLGNVRRLKECR